VIVRLGLYGFIITVVFISQVAAQSAPAHTPPVTPEWETSLAFGFNLTQGNSDTLLATGTFKTGLEQPKHLFNFELNGSYGESEDEVTQEDIKGAFEYKYLFTKRTYLGLRTTGEFDDVADVDYRVIMSPAIGYFPVKNDTYKLNVEIGPSYVFEKLDGEEDDYVNGRIADRFSWKISETSKFFQFFEYLHSLEDSDKYLINAELGVEASITTDLALVLTVRDSYDNQPAAESEKNDVEIISSLKISL